MVASLVSGSERDPVSRKWGREWLSKTPSVFLWLPHTHMPIPSHTQMYMFTSHTFTLRVQTTQTKKMAALNFGFIKIKHSFLKRRCHEETFSIKAPANFGLALHFKPLKAPLPFPFPTPYWKWEALPGPHCVTGNAKEQVGECQHQLTAKHFNRENP